MPSVHTLSIDADLSHTQSNALPLFLFKNNSLSSVDTVISCAQITSSAMSSPKQPKLNIEICEKFQSIKYKNKICLVCNLLNLQLDRDTLFNRIYSFMSLHAWSFCGTGIFQKHRPSFV